MRFREFAVPLFEDDSSVVAAGLANFIQHRWNDFAEKGSMPTSQFIHMVQNWDIPITFDILQTMRDDPESPLNKLIANLTKDTITFGAKGDETESAPEDTAQAPAGDAVAPEIKVAQMANRALNNRQ
jgi:hypothetical protein